MPEPKTHTEPQLLQQVARGNESAFRVLFDAHADRIYATAFAFTKSVEQSRDLVQEVFARIWVKREALTGIQTFEAYLYTMTRNAALNVLREKTYIPANTDFFETYFNATHISTQEELDLKELQSLIEQGISELPPQQEKAFRLSRYQGLSLAEIAKEMDVSEETAKSHLTRALARLRKYLDERRDLLTLIWMLLFL